MNGCRRYAAGKLLGKGAFGRVNIGVHKLTGQLVALKIHERKKVPPHLREIEVDAGSTPDAGLASHQVQGPHPLQNSLLINRGHRTNTPLRKLIRVAFFGFVFFVTWYLKTIILVITVLLSFLYYFILGFIIYLFLLLQDILYCGMQCRLRMLIPRTIISMMKLNTSKASSRSHPH